MKKKYVKSAICTLFAIILTIACVMSDSAFSGKMVQAKAKTVRSIKSACKEEYQKFLRKHTEVELFLVHDMNQDSVPDLVVQTEKYVKIYTLKNDKVKKVFSKKITGKNASSMIAASNTRQQFAIIINNDSGFRKFAYSTNYKQLESVYENWDTGTYKIDGKKTTEKKFKGALNDVYMSDMYYTYYDYSMYLPAEIDNLEVK